MGGENRKDVTVFLCSWVQNALLTLGTLGGNSASFGKVVQLRPLKPAGAHSKAGGVGGTPTLPCFLRGSLSRVGTWFEPETEASAPGFSAPVSSAHPALCQRLGWAEDRRSPLVGRALPCRLLKVGRPREQGGVAGLSARTPGCRQQENLTQTAPAPDPGKSHALSAAWGSCSTSPGLRPGLPGTK